MWSALALFLLSGAAMAQTVVINNVTAQSPVHYADDADFSVGTLTITFNMPTGQTAGELEVRLSSGIEYLGGTVVATGATVALKAGSTNANKPVFTITGATGAVTIALKRKATKAVLSNPDIANGLQDGAVLTVGGVSSSEKKNMTSYQLLRPTLTIQLPSAVSDAIGARTESITIRNTGQGKVRDVYFSIAYATDVVGNKVL